MFTNLIFSSKAERSTRALPACYVSCSLQPCSPENFSAHPQSTSLRGRLEQLTEHADKACVDCSAFELKIELINIHFTAKSFHNHDCHE